MKPRLRLLSGALIVVLSAALWGVDYRLNHPPLSAADREFRALVADAKRVEVWQWDCQPIDDCQKGSAVYYPKWDGAQAQNFARQLRFTDANAAPFSPDKTYCLNLTFWHKTRGAQPLSFSLLQTPRASQLVRIDPTQTSNGIVRTYPVNPRFEQSLDAHLDQVLPKRKRR